MSIGTKKRPLFKSAKKKMKPFNFKIPLFSENHKIWEKSFKNHPNTLLSSPTSKNGLHVIEEESNEAESVYVDDIKKLTESEKKKYIKLIETRYPKQQYFFFILMYKLNPYRKNKPFLRCIISFLRFFLITIALLLELYYDLRGIFLVPLFFNVMVRLMFTMYQAYVQKFKVIKRQYFLLVLNHIVTLTFIVSSFILSNSNFLGRAHGDVHQRHQERTEKGLDRDFSVLRTQTHPLLLQEEIQNHCPECQRPPSPALLPHPGFLLQLQSHPIPGLAQL